MNHGGKRKGAGRKIGSKNISDEVKEAFQQHTDTAINAIVAIANDSDHPQHFKALELILNRGVGLPTVQSPAEPVITSYLAGEITAVDAGLLIESKGLQVSKQLFTEINTERYSEEIPFF